MRRARPERHGVARRFVGVVGLSVLLGAGCTADPQPEETADNPTTETAFGTKPDIASLLDPERGEPPASLEVVDLVEGDGDPVAPGVVAVVHYAGASWRTGVEFDATWDVDEPYEFEVGAGRVIEGWERGIGGDGDIAPMQVGGRRMLTIPPQLAYGDRGAGEAIAPGDTLVYVIELLEVEPATPTSP